MKDHWRFFLFIIFYCQLFWLGHLSMRQEAYAKEFAMSERPLTFVNGVLDQLVERNYWHIDKYASMYKNPANDSIRNAARKYGEFMQTVGHEQVRDSMIQLVQQFMPDSTQIMLEKAQRIEAVAQLPNVHTKHEAIYQKLKNQLDTCQRRSSEVWLTQGLGHLMYKDDTLFDTMLLGVVTTPGVLRAGDTWKGSVQFWHGSKSANNVSISINGNQVKSEGSIAKGFLIAQEKTRNLDLMYCIKNPLTGEVKIYQNRQPLPIIE
jgi:hypothetical protein